MKKLVYAYSSSTLNNILDEIECIVLVDDAMQMSPRRSLVFASENKYHDKYFYMGLTHEQLLQLPKREFKNLKDLEILRKLNKEDLTPDQLRILYQANKDNFLSSRKEVRAALDKIQACKYVNIYPFRKNISFANEIAEKGGQVTSKDVKAIIDSLQLEDYSYSTYSILDDDWNSLLMVFEYAGDYTFQPNDENGEPVTIAQMDIYIKVDIDSVSKTGYGVLSFHNPEFKMDHPYK